MAHRMLIEAMDAEEGEMIICDADEVRAIAQQGFFDGIRMAAELVDDPLTKAKLWALIRNAPNPSPSFT
ncbi:MAG: hypothetical protein AAFR21_14960 [Pseudomonadota bacterium]